MKPALIVVRLLVEAAFGLICLSACLLLPSIWEGTFPWLLMIGLLGMPHHYHAFVDAGFRHINITSVSSLLLAVVLILLGALCLRDVWRIVRRLISKSI